MSLSQAPAREAQAESEQGKRAFWGGVELSGKEGKAEASLCEDQQEVWVVCDGQRGKVGTHRGEAGSGWGCSLRTQSARPGLKSALWYQQGNGVVGLVSEKALSVFSVETDGKDHG